MKNALNRKGWCALVFSGPSTSGLLFFVVFLNSSNPFTVQQKEATLLPFKWFPIHHSWGILRPSKLYRSSYTRR